jgi:hypothetical protein
MGLMPGMDSPYHDKMAQRKSIGAPSGQSDVTNCHHRAQMTRHPKFSKISKNFADLAT